MSLAARVLEAARQTCQTIATAESCTGGLIAGALTEVPGSSAVIMGGIVSYSNGAKQTLLSVTPETLDRFGAVSEEVAGEMAQGALRALPEATLAVSVTGIAGPGGSAFKPEGRVCFGLAQAASCSTETIDFGPLGRKAVRQAATDHALRLLLSVLER